MNRFIFRAQSFASILLSPSGMIDCQMIYLAYALYFLHSTLDSIRFPCAHISLMRHFQSIYRSTIENLFIEEKRTR